MVIFAPGPSLWTPASYATAFIQLPNLLLSQNFACLPNSFPFSHPPPPLSQPISNDHGSFTIVRYIALDDTEMTSG
jgi:hypothetical protein